MAIGRAKVCFGAIANSSEQIKQRAERELEILPGPKTVKADSHQGSVDKQTRASQKGQIPPVSPKVRRGNQPNLRKNMSLENDDNPFQGTQDGHIIMVNPSQLKVHPEIENFPGLSAGQLLALTNDIRAKGVLDPLRINSKNQVLDGRHRLKIAIELHLPTVPVFIDDESNPIEVAIRTALLKRHFNQSMAAFTLFEYFPGLRSDRQDRQKKFLLRGTKGGKWEFDPGKRAAVYDSPSSQEVAAKFSLPASYFSYLSQMYDNKDEGEWEKLRKAIFGELESEDQEKKAKGIPTLYAGFCGEMNTKGLPRNETAGPQKLFFRCFNALQRWAKQYEKEDSLIKHDILKEWHKTLAVLPEDFHREYAEFLERKKETEKN